jgi:glutathione reductase (NADPH)
MYYAMMEKEDKAPTRYKIVCQGPDEKVVGLHLLGQGSAEIMQGFALGLKMGATKQDFDSVVAIHPISAEEIVTMK